MRVDDAVDSTGDVLEFEVETGLRRGVSSGGNGLVTGVTKLACWKRFLAARMDDASGVSLGVGGFISTGGLGSGDCRGGNRFSANCRLDMAAEDGVYDTLVPSGEKLWWRLPAWVRCFHS